MVIQLAWPFLLLELLMTNGMSKYHRYLVQPVTGASRLK